MPVKHDYRLPYQKSLNHASNYPVITNVQATGQGLITWTTDIASSSQVLYSTSPYLGLLSPYDSTNVTSHSVQLTDLVEGETYYFRVQSFYLDALSTSDLYSFVFTGTVYAPIASNLTTRLSFDANNTSLDELADVLGSLVTAFNLGSTVTTSFTATNVTTDTSYDATDTSLDELADVLGSLIASLTPTGTSSDVYTVTNQTQILVYDADNTSLNELARGIGTLIDRLQDEGVIN